MANLNDEVRDAILRQLYDVLQRAKSPQSAGVKISDLQKAMRDKHDYKQQLVASNLEYLIQKGWAIKEVEQRSITTARGTQQPASKVTYKISAVGIDLLEGASTFQRPPTGVNITNMSGVTIIGDGNVVNAQFTDLTRTLTQLRTAVLSSSEVDEPTKLDVVGDIDTLQSQLQKPEPDRSIVQRAWSAIEKVVTVGELAQLSATAAQLIAPLLS